MTRIVARNSYITSTVLILSGFVAAANAASDSTSRGPVPTVTPTPASYWGVNATFSASGQNYLLVTSDTYNDYYVRSTSSGGYQWSYSKSGSWSNVPSYYISSTLSSQLAAYFGGGADDPPTPPPTTPTPPPSTPTPPAASVPTVTPTPASYWGVNATFSASGQDYLLVTSDTYDNYYVRSTSSGGYQWSYSKSGSWLNVPSYYISSTLSSQLAGYFGVAQSPIPPDLMPDFSGVTVPAKRWTKNRAITAFTVPAATGGDGVLTYSAAGWPAGVTMSSTRVVSGTPTAVGSGTATITATDTDGDIDTLDIPWTVDSDTDLVPTFGSASISAQSWSPGQPIQGFSVGPASSGNAPLSYAVSGLPMGVTMSSAREFSGTPAEAGSGIATLTATDADGDTATLTFSWTVPEDSAPSFGSATIAAKSWTVGKPIAEFVAPAASGGNGALSYGAYGLPNGVVLLANSWKFSGTPTSAGSGTATLAVWDSDGSHDTLNFSWTVSADAAPAFGSASVPPQSWTAGEPIATFALPLAAGGNAPVSYGAALLPEGIIVTPSLAVSGMPMATGSGSARITARDGDGDIDTLTFAWTVASPNEPVTGEVLSADPNPAGGPDFTVTGDLSDIRDYDRLTLAEENPWRQTKESDIDAATFSTGGVAVENKVNGIYRYRLNGCYLERIPRLGKAVEICETVGDPLVVTVDGPAPDAVATQLRATYEMRIRDPNGDGVGDALHIRRTSSAAGGGLFTHALLRKVPERGLELVPPESDAAPKSAEVSLWPVTVSAELVPGDFNGDGFVDVLVRGLGNAIAGARDRIVYAPGRLGGAPVHSQAMDDEYGSLQSAASQPYDGVTRQTGPALRAVCKRFDARSYCSAFPVDSVDGSRPRRALVW